MKKLYTYLTYAGAIPFIICAVFLMLNIREFTLLGSTDAILSAYALAIASFLSGTHWGQHFHMQGRWRLTLPILSNINTIVLWLSFVTLRFKALTVVFSFIFVILLVIDYRLFRYGLLTRQYIHARCVVTSIVIATLIVSGAVS